jgi:hypothetical protein
MLGSVMPLDALRKTTSLRRGEGFVEAVGTMSVKVILNQNDLLGIGVHLITEVEYYLSIV